jgi:hypothetical protein
MTKPVRLTWRVPAWLLRSWGDKGLVLVVIVVAVIGLPRLEFPAARPTCGLKVDEPGGSGIIVHDEVLDAWLPETFIALAADEYTNLIASTHQQLQTSL